MNRPFRPFPGVFFALAAVLCGLAVGANQPPDKPPSPPLQGQYVKKSSRVETICATLASYGLPNLQGKWYYVGPFDNTDNVGFDTPYPPERTVDLTASYLGKRDRKIGWKEFPDFPIGKVVNLVPLFPRDNRNAVVYLYHRFESPLAFRMRLSLGSDDTLSVFFNGKRIHHEPHFRPAAPDQDFVDLDVRKGTNELLIKIGQLGGDWAVYVAPAELPAVVPAAVRLQLARDFAVSAAPAGTVGREAVYYQVLTIPLPEECVLEVGGLAFRPDGKLLACTRRGEIWLIDQATADDPSTARFQLFAAGLHEALGLYVENNQTVYVVQRPELTKIVDRDGDGRADEFVTVCDRWGVSGDYHEFAFGPARDRQGNFYITLNVGFGGGHQAKAPWRGWCVRVTPDGRLEPYAFGLRSPNGVNFSPDGDLFYCDNQGEWVATNKMHHVKPGQFYGHQASLRWLKLSPFAELAAKPYPSSMRYDGTDSAGRFTGNYPPHDPPAIWFPYGRMGQSASEPVWDTTGGKFGPFAGQCFVGDQTRSMIMRVALEKIDGVYQGACFPFRSGLQCGVNRLCFAPDGSLMVGQTNRGWGSIGSKPYGLQRLVFTGKTPMEIHHIRLVRDGFELVFTKPLPPQPSWDRAVSVTSFTYNYWSTYGSPEVDTRAEKVAAVNLVGPQTLRLNVPNLRRGRVYEFRLDGIQSTDGEPLLHPEAYYTLNVLPR